MSEFEKKETGAPASRGGDVRDASVASDARPFDALKNQTVAKYLLIALVSVAVIVAAVAAMVVSSKRAETAAALAEKAESEAAKAKSVAKTAAANAAAEDAKARAKEAEAKAAADNRKAKASEAEVAKEAAAKAESDRKAAIENRAAREAEAAKARDTREAAKIAAETAASEKAKAVESAKAEKAAAEKAAYELETEKIRSEASIAEAKRLENLKIDYQTWASNLREKEQELLERERALTPEKTITDLPGGGLEDTVIDADGNVRKQVKVVYRAEDDKTLPRSSRQLAKTLRELDEMASNETSRVRAAIVTPLEKEYAQALKEDRVLDANYIADAIKLLYPDWKFTVEETKETEGTEETEQDLTTKGNNETNL